MISPRVMHIDTGIVFRGGQRQVLLLTQRLESLGIDQVVACPEGSALLERLPDGAAPVLSSRSILRKMYLRPLRDAIAKHQINILHAHNSEGHTLGVLLKAALPHLKLVVTRRVTFPPGRMLSGPLKYRRQVDCYIAISQAVADSLVAIGVDKASIKVIPSGIDLSALQNIPAGGGAIDEIAHRYRYVIATAGALTAEKDFATAIRVAEMVQDRLPGTVLLIMGDGPLRRELATLAAERGRDAVHLLGYREPLATIFKRCRLFLLTSQSEGLNTSAIEAAACGLPLVVSNVGGLPEVVEEGYNGVLCPPGRPEPYAEAVFDLLTHDDKRERMAANSLVRAARFDIDKVAAETVDVYKRILVEQEGDV